MKNYDAKNVPAYIAGAPGVARPHLTALRRVVRNTVPLATESISWGIPFYKYNGLLAGYAAFARHVSFGFCAVIPQDVREALAAKGYASGKKTVQIRHDQKVPTVLIARLLKAQARLNDAKKTR